MKNYAAPWWLCGGHVQTLWAFALARHGVLPPVQRTRWHAPDGDFIDLDWLITTDKNRPLLVLFHGLEGSSSSHYAINFLAWAQRHQVHAVVVHFRGCSGELNLAPRAYHSGDIAEIDWILQRIKAERLSAGCNPTVWAVGVSLGGNALLRWAGEVGQCAHAYINAAVAISSPLDLWASGNHLAKGLNRWLYTPFFLHSMKPKAMAKWQQYPGLFDVATLQRARTIYAFDDVFTAPLHGFKGVEDYWRRASAKPHLHAIRLPCLIVNACNDPFIPVESMVGSSDIAVDTVLWQPASGGHVGFVSGTFPGSTQVLSDAVGGWLMALAAG